MTSPHASALIIAGVGTVVLRHDGSVAIVDRNRNRFEIDPAIVRAICALASKPPVPWVNTWQERAAAAELEKAGLQFRGLTKKEIQ